MRLIWLSFADISVLGTAVIWLFISGWTGAFPWLPDLGLLSRGLWLTWLFCVLIQYGPIGVAISSPCFGAEERSTRTPIPIRS